MNVQCSRDQYEIFDVMIPNDLVRQLPLLKYLFHLRGSHIERTAFFNKHVYSVDQHENQDNSQYQ